jgi:hypothetical protein
MRKMGRSVITAAICSLGLIGPVGAQSSDAQPAPKTRAEVRIEQKEFIRSHVWDEEAGNWVLKPGFRPPEGVKSREEIRATRNSFMKGNRWNEEASRWEPISGPPRDISKLSRAEVRRETAAFLKTHRWDLEKDAYVEVKPR